MALLCSPSTAKNTLEQHELRSTIRYVVGKVYYNRLGNRIALAYDLHWSLWCGVGWNSSFAAGWNVARCNKKMNRSKTILLVTLPAVFAVSYRAIVQYLVYSENRPNLYNIQSCIHLINSSYVLTFVPIKLSTISLESLQVLTMPASFEHQNLLLAAILTSPSGDRFVYRCFARDTNIT